VLPKVSKDQPPKVLTDKNVWFYSMVILVDCSQCSWLLSCSSFEPDLITFVTFQLSRVALILAYHFICSSRDLSLLYLCFKIVLYSVLVTQIRRHADNVFSFIIMPAMHSRGIDCVRSDMITDIGQVNVSLILKLVLLAY
jgi:hypothetical protein